MNILMKIDSSTRAMIEGDPYEIRGFGFTQRNPRKPGGKVTMEFAPIHGGQMIRMEIDAPAISAEDDALRVLAQILNH